MDAIIISDAKDKFDNIKFTVAGINGISKTKIITKHVIEKFLTEGAPEHAAAVGSSFDGCFVHDKIPHLAKGNDGNGLWIPKLETLTELSGTSDDGVLGEVYCEVMYNSPAGPVSQPACPRYMARNQLQILRSMGYELYSAFENEPLILDAQTQQPLWADIKFVGTNIGFMKSKDMILKVLKRSNAQGLKLEACHLEYAPGQLEFVTLPLTGIQSMDNVFAFKDLLREVMMEYGKISSFMTMPFLENLCANGLHFNHSLRTTLNNIPVCYDESSENKLSDVTVHWVGGILKHLPALTALCCPTVNCYRRLGKPFAPGRINWGIDDRHVTIRVKNTSPEGCYVESRLPSSAANPYVVVAATVAAGIDGLISKDKCPLTKAEGLEGDVLPATLDEALDALAKDTVLTEALGSEFITWFTLLKRAEIEKLGGSDVSDTSKDRMDNERELYMDLL